MTDASAIQSRDKITEAKAYENAEHRKLDEMSPEVFASAGARTPHPALLGKPHVPNQSRQILQRQRPKRHGSGEESHRQLQRPMRGQSLLILSNWHKLPTRYMNITRVAQAQHTWTICSIIKESPMITA